MSKKTDFEKLIEEALENAIADRKIAMDAYDKVKNVWDIDLQTNEESKAKNLQGLMLIGQNVVKLIEQLSRSNEQIIKLSQIKEKNESSNKKDAKKPFDVSSIMKTEGSDEQYE